MSKFYETKDTYITDYKPLIKALIKAARMAKPKGLPLLKYEEVQLIINFLRELKQNSNIYHIMGVPFDKSDFFNGTMIKINNEFISALEYKSKFYEPPTETQVKKGTDFNNNLVYVKKGKEYIKLDSWDKSEAQSLDIDALLDSAKKLGRITQEEYQELQAEVDRDYEEYIDKLDRVYAEEVNKIRQRENEVYLALKNAYQMSKSGFSKERMITPHDFKAIVVYLKDKMEYAKIKKIYGNVENSENPLASNIEGFMIKIGGELVSLVTRTQNQYEKDSEFLKPTNEYIVIGTNFGNWFKINVIPYSPVPRKVQGTPIDRLDIDQIESVDIEALIKEIEEKGLYQIGSDTMREEGITPDNIEVEPEGDGTNVRAAEEAGIVENNKEIVQLRDEVEKLLGEIEVAKEALAKAEEKKGQASDVSVETKEQ